VTRPLDGRRAQALYAELLRRAEAELTDEGTTLPVGPIAKSVFAIAGRIGEEVTSRLDRVPDKQTDNFYAAMGIGRDPARPARVPVAFKLADPAPRDMVAPAATRLTAQVEGPPIVFETERGIALVPGTIAALRAADAASDSIYLPPPGIVAGALPRAEPMVRVLRSGAAAGADKLQVDPVAGLAPGMMLRLGLGPDAPQHVIVGLESELLTIDPPLDATLADDTPVREVTDFAPFAPGARDRQSHALYLGHETLLDVPSPITVIVSGLEVPGATGWSWWGQAGEDDPPAWQPFEAEFEVPNWVLKKRAGKPLKTKINERDSLWLRAHLPGKSSESGLGQDVRLRVAGDTTCEAKHEERCLDPPPSKIEFEAVSVTTPIVPNQPFHPFGREPRLYDAFYVGCSEAFSKDGAEVSLCIKLGGPDLGPLAAVSDGVRLQIFGVGSDGILYRADFGADASQLVAVPHEGERFLPQAPVAACLVGATIHVGVAGPNGVETATLGIQSNPESVTWASLKAPETYEAGDVKGIAAVANVPGPLFMALLKQDLITWQPDAQGKPQPAKHDFAVAHLAPLQGTGAAVFFEAGQTTQTLLRWRPSMANAEALAQIPSANMPSSGLAAWAQADDADTLYLAGFEPQPSAIQFYRLELGTPNVLTELGNPLPSAEMPIAFEPPLSQGDPPSALVATDPPLRFVAVDDRYHSSPEPRAIGFRSEPRQFVVQHGWTIVQHDDLGLLYRRNDGGGSSEQAKLVVSEFLLLLDEAGAPDGAVYATLQGADRERGEAYAFVEDGPLHRLLRPIPPFAGTMRRIANLDLHRLSPDAIAGAVTHVSTSPRIVRLSPHPAAMGATPTISDLVINILLTDAAAPDEPTLWELTRPAATGEEWIPTDSDFPDVQTGNFTFALLEPISANALPIQEAAYLQNLSEVEAWLQRGPIIPVEAGGARLESLDRSGSQPLVRIAHSLIAAGQVSVLLAPPAWAHLGPDQPANPAISWEYWNGQSWWALESSDLKDRTVNLLVDGGVFFKVPPDIKPAEVVGRKNHWIRARLVGGDYGEARVTVATVTDTVANKSEQTVTRDLSAIRAPHIIRLDIGYCVKERVLPERVLTEDNLGFIDQTSANQAGLPIKVFVPLAELMNPLPVPAQGASVVDESCGEPCPPPDAAGEPSPCDAPGAYDSCDSPCVAPADYESPASSAAGSNAFVRGLLIGFDEPFRADPLSLFIDAAPSGAETALSADVFRAGRFEPVRIVRDGSYGFSEPGAVEIELLTPPDRTTLFGVSAHWLRLSTPGSWSPRLRGIYLNAVTATSLESRRNESLGGSSGAPDQVFRLVHPPIADGSLELRISEQVGEEEARSLDARPHIEGMPGPWVRWREVPDLRDAEPTDRVFALDAETGALRFGDGRRGAMPPLGSELLAVAYQHVTGTAANAVSPLSSIELLSPIAGVDKLRALDVAAGGSDVEGAADARRRGAAKMRHGGRVVTLADIEDFVRARKTEVAQVRASNWRGGVRIVIAQKGAEVRPAPAMLRELAAEVGESGSYVIARDGGLSAVAPRLLPIEVQAQIEPDDEGEFVNLVDQARDLLVAFFDPGSGGHDGSGWPIGGLPGAVDVAAALEALSSRAVVSEIVLRRLDRDPSEPLPSAIPADVLVGVHAEDVQVTRHRDLQSAA
jgi:hypothetical protein